MEKESISIHFGSLDNRTDKAKNSVGSFSKLENVHRNTDGQLNKRNGIDYVVGLSNGEALIVTEDNRFSVIDDSQLKTYSEDQESFIGSNVVANTEVAIGKKRFKKGIGGTSLSTSIGNNKFTLIAGGAGFTTPECFIEAVDSDGVYLGESEIVGPIWGLDSILIGETPYIVLLYSFKIELWSWDLENGAFVLSKLPGFVAGSVGVGTQLSHSTGLSACLSPDGDYIGIAYLNGFATYEALPPFNFINYRERLSAFSGNKSLDIVSVKSPVNNDLLFVECVFEYTSGDRLYGLTIWLVTSSTGNIITTISDTRLEIAGHSPQGIVGANCSVVSKEGGSESVYAYFGIYQGIKGVSPDTMLYAEDSITKTYLDLDTLNSVTTEHWLKNWVICSKSFVDDGVVLFSVSPSTATREPFGTPPGQITDPDEGVLPSRGQYQLIGDDTKRREVPERSPDVLNGNQIVKARWLFLRYTGEDFLSTYPAIKTLTRWWKNNGKWISTTKENSTGKVIINPPPLIPARLVSIAFKKQQTHKSWSAGAFLTGGTGGFFDTRQYLNAGFSCNPRCVAVETTHSAALGRTDRWVAVYEYEDSSGQTWLSGVSQPVTWDYALEPVRPAIYVLKPSIGVMEKSDHSLKVKLFRQDVLSGVYYLDRYTFISNKYPDNLLGHVVFGADTNYLGDEQLLASERLYTSGGVLEVDPPPPSLISTLYKNRIWLVDSTNPGRLWFSRAINPGFAPEFSGEFTYTIGGENNFAGGIKSIYELDERLIILGTQSIFYIQGDGPSDTGSSNDFSSPQSISTTIGCINHRATISSNIGLFFASNDGMYLLDRGLSLKFVGAGIYKEDLLKISSTVSIPKKSEIRWCLDDKILVLNTVSMNWTIFTNGSTIDSETIDGKHLFLKDNGIFIESEDFSDDTGYHIDAPIQIKISTAWLSRKDILQGFMRVWRILLYGGWKSDHSLKLEISYDYKEIVEGVYEIANVSSVDPLQFDFHLIRQKCQSLKIAFTEVPTSSINTVISSSKIVTSSAWSEAAVQEVFKLSGPALGVSPDFDWIQSWGVFGIANSTEDIPTTIGFGFYDSSYIGYEDNFTADIEYSVDLFNLTDALLWQTIGSHLTSNPDWFTVSSISAAGLTATNVHAGSVPTFLSSEPYNNLDYEVITAGKNTAPAISGGWFIIGYNNSDTAGFWYNIGGTSVPDDLVLEAPTQTFPITDVLIIDDQDVVAQKTNSAIIASGLFTGTVIQNEISFSPIFIGVVPRSKYSTQIGERFTFITVDDGDSRQGWGESLNISDVYIEIGKKKHSKPFAKENKIKGIKV